MRSGRRDRPAESFYAQRTTNLSVAGGAAAWRNINFNVMQSDRTDGKIVFIPDSRFVFVAKENEMWHFSLAANWFTSAAVNDLLAVGGWAPTIGTFAVETYYASAVSATYYLAGSVTLPFKPGETFYPQAYSGNATDNGLGTLTFCSGVRVA